MNIAESAALERVFVSHGWNKACSVQVADVVVINTCSVRESAEERIVGRLGFFSSLKKARSGEEGAKKRGLEEASDLVSKNGVKPLTLIVTGCMAQRLLGSMKEKFPFVDYVIGSFEKSNFSKLIECIEKGEKYLREDGAKSYEFSPLSYQEGTFSSFVPVMHGCGNFCTYCIVPHVRGPEVCRPISDIINEITFLSEKGVKEITLLGQNVNSYMEAGCDFASLLKRICSHLESLSSPIEWIRFESSNPNDFTDSMIDTIASESRLCSGLHIAVQHASDSVLKRMNRHYTADDYRLLAQKLREKIPDVALSTDIMVGFPGERDEDFETLISFIREIGFESAFMYYFNPREGTPATKMPDQIPLDVKKKRLQRLIDTQLELGRKAMSKRVGQTVKVLADIVSRDSPNELLGKTEQNGRVAFSAKQEIIGSFINVRLDSLNGNTFKGALIN